MGLNDEDAAEQKRLFKEALSEWLDKKFAEFGYYSVRTIGVATFGVVLWLWLVSNGWHK